MIYQHVNLVKNLKWILKIMVQNIAFTFSHVDKSLVEHMRDLFFADNKLLLSYDIKEDEIKEINLKYVLRILLTPKQYELDFEGAAI